MRIVSLFLAALITAPANAAPGTPAVETCPSAEEVGSNVECYPVTFTAKTEIHPDGIPIIAYLFVPTDRPPGEPLPAIVFAHGSGSMYSDGNHNKGLNSKHKQWVRQYTGELGIVGLHVDSFHSRYLLPDTEGDQRILEIDVPPEGLVGGDDYRATSYLGYREDADGNPLPYEYIAFDPDPADDGDKWKDSGNGGAGVSEVMERAYDMDAAWDFLAGIRKGRVIESSRNDDAEQATLGTPMAGVGYIGEIVNNGLVVDHERIFLYGTSHGGQTAMATAHAPRALGNANPMNADLPVQFNRHRFAAFFDYYGGCGLDGAYGGSSNSTWRPYAPFLMLHGDHDDEAVFDEDEVPIDSLEEFRLTACGRRIAAAKNDNGFDQFLEVIVYRDAYHSFDGLERGDVNSEEDPDFGSWLAKIHANYRVTLPFMQAIGRIVSADRNDTEIPSLADFAFTPERLQFIAVPFDPWIPPAFVVHGPQVEEPVEIPDLGNHDLQLTDYVSDPAAFYPLTCEAINLSENVSLEDCVLKFRTSPNDSGNMERIRVLTPLGSTIIEGSLNRSASTLTFNAQERQQPPAGKFFHIPVTNNEFAFDVRSFFSTTDRYWHNLNYQGLMTWIVAPVYPFDLAGLVRGQPPSSSITETLVAHMDSMGTTFEYTIGPSASTSEVEIRCCTYIDFTSRQRTPSTLPPTDFNTGFEPLPAVSEPQAPGDGSDDPGNGPGEEPGDETGEGPGDDDNSGNTNPGDPDTGSSDSGGGVLLWLLAFAPMLRRLQAQ